MPPLVAYNTRALIGQPGDDDIIQPADCICSMVGGEGQLDDGSGLPGEYLTTARVASQIAPRLPINTFSSFSGPYILHCSL